MDPFQHHAGGLSDLQDRLGGACPQFIWPASSDPMQIWLALPGGAKLRKENGQGGLSFDADLSITCLVAQFGTDADTQREAMLNTHLQYLGRNYRIDAVVIAPGALQLRLLCMSDVQKL